MSDVILPAQLEYMLTSLKDPNDSVWQRQAFRDRLTAIRDKIDASLKHFEQEFKKEAQKQAKTKKGKK